MDVTPTGETVPEIDIVRVMELIPHRYPLLMVDRVIDVVPDVSAVGIKNVSINEVQFLGHFPERPIMPGVLIVEAMAQTAAVLVVQTLGRESEGKLVYFMSIENAKFRRPVTPGDCMRIHVNKLRQRRNVWKFTGEARVDDAVCADATFAAMIMDR